MSRVLYDCKLKLIRDLTPSIRELSIEFVQPEGFAFKAGQFIMMQVPDPGKAKAAQRAYSIASSDQDSKNLRLVIKLYGQGLASNFVKQLKGGEDLKLSGPFGRHFFELPATPKVNFICTGAGVSQHMSYLLSHSKDLEHTKARMLLGVWNQTEIFYEKELTEIKNKLPDFDFQFVLDKSEAQWKGKTGFVTQYFDELNLDHQSTVYLCGNPNMIKSAKEILFTKYSMTEAQVIAEAFNS